MADIRVERKKGIPVWVILLALIILALIVWAVSSLRSRGHQGEVDRTAALAGPAQVIALEAREIFVSSAGYIRQGQPEFTAHTPAPASASSPRDRAAPFPDG